MSEHDSPGWQADPTGRHDHRYWDGTRWTDDVADAGVASTDVYDAGTAGTADIAGDAPTVIDQPVPSLGDDPTAVPSAPADATSTWASTPAVPPPPPFVLSAAGPDEPAPSKKGLLIGGGILAIVVLALIAFFVLGGDDDDDDRGRVHSQLASELRDDGELTKDQADCVADHIIDEVGIDKLKDVDFSADEPPAALASELGDAAISSISKCDIDPSGVNEDEDDDLDDGDALSPGDIDGFGPAFEDQLAEVYSGMGIAPDKAKCLAGKIADAVESGKLEADDAMSDIFSFFSACDINPSELTGG